MTAAESDSAAPGTPFPRLSPASCRDLARPFAHPWNRQYAYWKLRTDPLYPAASAPLLAVDDGKTGVLDLGCGLGLFASYLKGAGFGGPVTGLDYDLRKVRAARRRFSGNADGGLAFEHADVRAALPPFHGHVTILDVLQYMDGSQRRILLDDAVNVLAPGALLVIRTGVAEPNWRFRVTQLADWCAHGCLWMKGSPVCYPRRSEVEDLLHARGLEGHFAPLWGRTPFNNYLGVFRAGADGRLP